MVQTDDRRRRSEPPRILLVDDEEINREITARMLEIAGYAVDREENGLDAVEAAARTRYDLILLDCQLPGMDGWTAARTIREAEAPGRRVPIVAVTAGTGGDDRARAAESGMDGLLAKPFEPEELRAEVEHRLADAPAPEEGADAPAAAEADPSPDAPPTIATPMDPADHETPVVVSRLVEIAGGDMEFMRTLIRIFLRDAEQHIVKLENALQEQQTDTVLYEAHAIKGASGHAGASALRSIAGAIEEMAENGRTGSIPETMTDLKAEFRRVRSFLETVGKD